jgi:hypothetical protein
MVNALLLDHWTVTGHEKTATAHTIDASYNLEPTACPKCGVVGAKFYKHGPAVVEYTDAPNFGRRCIIRVATRRMKCLDCRATFMQPLPDFAFCSKDIKNLRTARDAIGPENDYHIEQAMRDADLVIAAWGPLLKLPNHLRSRWRRVVGIADRTGKPLWCLGTAQDGHPRHTLMLPYTAELKLWKIGTGRT